MKDYLITFLSILIGYIVTQFFAGWQAMISEIPSIHNLYWLHLGWTILDFIYMIYIWWVFGFFRQEIVRSFFSFFITLIPCFLLYLIATFLFPSSLEQISTVNFRVFYSDNSSALFTCYSGLMFFSTIAAPKIFKESPFLNKRTYLRASLFTMFTVAIFCQNQIYHSIVFAASCATIVLFIYQYYNKYQISKTTNNKNFKDVVYIINEPYNKKYEKRSSK